MSENHCIIYNLLTNLSRTKINRRLGQCQDAVVVALHTSIYSELSIRTQITVFEKEQEEFGMKATG